MFPVKKVLQRSPQNFYFRLFKKKHFDNYLSDKEISILHWSKALSLQLCENWALVKECW